MMKNNSRTHNEALTHSTSDSAIVDMFFLFGALRHQSDSVIKTVLHNALNEDKVKTLKLLAYFRDIEQGIGERRVFRVSLQYLYDNNMYDCLEVFITNIKPLIYDNIARVDDFIWLANHIIKKDGYNKNSYVSEILITLMSLLEDKKISGIVAKWMPRKKGQYGRVVKYMRRNGIIETFSTYRKKIVSLSNTVEQAMSDKKWKGIDLSKVPSIAMRKYSKAFNRHGILTPFLDKLKKGETKINAQRLTPSNVVIDIINERYGGIDNSQRELLNQQWLNLKELDNLPKEFRALPVIDVSSSMYSPNNIPMSNSIGIGLYMAENNPNEVFRDHFITFTREPYFAKITGHDIYAKVHNALKTYGYNTDLQKVFELILKTSIDNNIPADEMPTHIVIISDMEFDSMVIDGTDVNTLQMMDRLYQQYEYERPQIVFWNVNGRLGNVPAKDNDKNVILVSGSSQNILNFILKKHYEDITGIIDEVVNDERYAFI